MSMRAKTRWLTQIRFKYVFQLKFDDGDCDGNDDNDNKDNDDDNGCGGSDDDDDDDDDEDDEDDEGVDCVNILITACLRVVNCLAPWLLPEWLLPGNFFPACDA